MIKCSDSREDDRRMIPISYIGEYFDQDSRITSGSRYYLLE